jgi:hypothetical protein
MEQASCFGGGQGGEINSEGDRREVPLRLLMGARLPRPPCTAPMQEARIATTALRGCLAFIRRATADIESLA